MTLNMFLHPWWRRADLNAIIIAKRKLPTTVALF